MTTKDNEAMPARANLHEALSVFLGEWRARIAGKAFDTLSILGVETTSEAYFARTFENHGFYRHYGLAVDDRTWMLEGETERARTVFDDDGATQTITWEWLRDGRWLPLCDRVATRVDGPPSATRRS